MRKSYGFTLAEVLITLVIIGVIAAMTIPTLMGSTNDQENKSALKKAVSALNQAVALDYALYGNTYGGDGCRNTCAAEQAWEQGHEENEENPGCDGVAEEDVIRDCGGGQGAIHSLLNRHLSVISDENNEITTADGIVFIPNSGNNIDVKPRGKNNSYQVGLCFEGGARAFLPCDPNERNGLYD